MERDGFKANQSTQIGFLSEQLLARVGWSNEPMQPSVQPNPHDEMTSGRIKLINSSRAASVGMREFFRVANYWSLTRKEQQLLLNVSASTLRRYELGQFRRGLRNPILARVSLVLNIYEATRILIANPARAHDWVQIPNQASGFDGRPALELMLNGFDGLVFVWRYLSSQRLE